MRTNDIPAQAKENPVIFDSYVKAKSVLAKYDNAMASISGGADSDIVLDICTHLDTDHQIKYIWFNTGLEYQATKDHLDYLEKRYGVEIKRLKAVKSVPTCCREYGQPFLSKYVSEQLDRLQRHNFQWEDRPYEELAKLYPRCTSSIHWWCNTRYVPNGFSTSRFNINRNYGLKEFILANPPEFKIAKECCNYAKKKTAIQAQIGYDLAILGVRRSEGGIRSVSYKNCYSHSEGGQDQYRPIFWYLKKDKEDYNRLFEIQNSDCYSVWGFERTGCVGCPYNLRLDQEIETVKQYEPRLYTACQAVFHDSYEYTRKYKKFMQEMKAERKRKST